MELKAARSPIGLLLAVLLAGRASAAAPRWNTPRQAPAQLLPAPAAAAPIPPVVATTPVQLASHSQVRLRAISSSSAAVSVPNPAPLPSPPTAEAVPLPAESATPTLALEDVLASVDRHFPLLLAAWEQRGIAAGQWTSAVGAFDLKLSASSYAEPLGFYQYYKTNTQLEKPTWWGGKVYGGYRLGRGRLPTWFGDDRTNLGGEARLGLETPLLQDRSFAKRRLEMRKAEIARQAVLPEIQRQRIEFLRTAAQVYWDWVAAGQSFRVARQLLQLARDRDEVLAKRVAQGDLAAMLRLENQGLIISRELKAIDAERKFLQSGIKLSLYFRDDLGFPVLPEASQAPAKFPLPPRLDSSRLDADIDLALRLRPELRELALDRQKTGAELAYAQNLLRPTLDAGLKASQDMGEEAPTRDKSPFELEATVYFDVPVQRRNAVGQVRASQSKLAQLTAKQRYYTDKVVTEVRDAWVVLETNQRQINAASRGAEIAREVEQLERRKFDLGASNLIFLNVREQATADARVREIETVQAHFVAWAAYRAALALDVQSRFDRPLNANLPAGIAPVPVPRPPGTPSPPVPPDVTD